MLGWNKAMISVIVPTYTNVSGLRQCLESVRKYTSGDYELIVVANGAPEETQAYLSITPLEKGLDNVVHEIPRPWLRHLWFDKPIGYTRAINEGIKVAKGDHFVLLNDDCIITGPGWLDVLQKPFLDDSHMGITGPQKEHDPNSHRDFLIFFCVMIGRKCWESLGGLDEVFSPGFGEDTDFCIRAERQGWKWKQVPGDEGHFLADHPNNSTLPPWKQQKMWVGDFPIYHDGEQTFGKLDDVGELLDRNRFILRLRYDGTVNIERALHTDGWMSPSELRWLAIQAAQHKVIVEVGSWHGRSSRAIADGMPPDATLWCIDTFNGSSGEPGFHDTAKLQEGDDAYLHFCNAMQDHIVAGRVKVLRMTSTNAASMLRTLGVKPDMIFIDGDHSLPGVTADLEHYHPLLAEGGVICGHDYFQIPEDWMRVVEGVNAHFQRVKVIPDTSIWVGGGVVRKRTVYDCFPFFNELDVLELRFAELDDVVDRWVITEGTMTYQGKPKPLLFDKNRERFAKWLHKITYVVVDDFPETKDPWVRERWQRDAIMRGLGDCYPDDVVIISDADEIASASAVRGYNVSQGLVRLKQHLFYGFANLEDERGWDWCKIAPFSLVKERTPCGIRYPEASTVPLIENGGWHFSFMGGPKAWVEKIEAYAHYEYNKPELKDEVTMLVRATSCQDILGRPDCTYKAVTDEQRYPVYLRANAEKFSHWFVQLEKKKASVTACVSTKDRYTTTLPMTLLAIAQQTVPPQRIEIYDDGEQKDLRQLSPFDGILHLFEAKGIEWEFFATPRLGQVSNHQQCLNTAKTEFIWRVDDDEAPAPDCLEQLLKAMEEDVGAVAGLVLVPGHVGPAIDWLDGSIEHIDDGPNLQWSFWDGGSREVDHLYSTFLYRVEAGRTVNYASNLSRIGHREETMFTYSIKRAGWKVLINPHAVTWHFQQMTGGIRTPDSKKEMWEHDEGIFNEFLAEFKVKKTVRQLIVLDCGLGDHLAFKEAFPRIKAMHPEREYTLAVCYPDIFPGERLLSIADAKQILGDKFDGTNFYHWMWSHQWKKSLPEAWEEMYK